MIPADLSPEAARLAPFQQLVKMIEREIQLAGEARIVELHDAVLARAEFSATLPSPPPAEAQQLLLRAQALHSRASIETQRLTEALDRQREARRLARAMARTYVRPPRPRSLSTAA